MSMHSLANELETQMRSLILDTANNNPAPKLGVIKEVSADNCYANINIDGGTINGIECFGYPKIGSKCIILFIDGNIEHMIALCNPINMSKYQESDMKLHYNICPNGSFEKLKDNKLLYWTGGIINKTKSYYGNSCCELKSKQTLLSDKIDIRSLQTEEEGDATPVMVSLFWQGGSMDWSILDQDGNEVVFTPYSLGVSKESLSEVEDWHFQRINFIPGLVTHIQIKLVNKSDKSSFIDGVRVWNPDDMREWYPCENE